MIGTLMPTRWYHPTASSGPVACRWEGWVSSAPAASGGVVWLVVDLLGLDVSTGVGILRLSR